METLSHLSNLYSHPDKFLEIHLLNTSNLALNFLANKSIQFIDKNIFADLTRITALSHDIGKSTESFQQYLIASESEKLKLKNRIETHHSLFSAMCGYFLVKEDLKIKSRQEEMLPFFSFLAIKRHHGDLEDVIDEAIIEPKDLENLSKQLKDIDFYKFSKLTDSLYKAGLPIKLDKEILMSWIELLPGELRKIKRQLRLLNGKDIRFYLLVNLLYSLLLDADKIEAGIGEQEVLNKNIENFDKELVDKYKLHQRYEDSLINAIREKAYKEVNSKEISLDNRIISLNLPTGLGKTLTVFSFVLRLRNKLAQELGVRAKIIYSLPFLSIIEQNYSILEEVLKSNNLPEIDTNILLKHHHLSDIYYKIKEEEFEPEWSKLLIEGWHSEIIVTTFLQLFHTLISYKNSTSRRFHQLSNAIIILDEVQSIPFKYWMVVKEMFYALTRELNSYVILVTATEPLIFERNEVHNLIKPEEYFKELNRVTLNPQLTTDLTLNEFAESIKLDDDKSYLFILNTISSAKEFFNLLKKKTNREIIFLSSHIVPKERLSRIEKLKKDKVNICVTTQLVEAGVDIDFDVLYRDLAPLDSVNQAAGRCNRNGRKHGFVYVVSLKNDKGKLYSSFIYDPILLDVTRKMLLSKKQFSESEFFGLINCYYYELVEKKSKDESSKLLEAISKLKFKSGDKSSSIADFKLIEDDYPKVDTFIEYDQEAAKIWEKYSYIREIKDYSKRRIYFNQIKANFYQYVISIPLNIKNLPPEVEGFRYVNMFSLEDFYDLKTGYKTDSETIIW